MLLFISFSNAKANINATFFHCTFIISRSRISYKFISYLPKNVHRLYPTYVFWLMALGILSPNSRNAIYSILTPSRISEIHFCERLDARFRPVAYKTVVSTLANIVSTTLAVYGSLYYLLVHIILLSTLPSITVVGLQSYITTYTILLCFSFSNFMVGIFF